MKWLGFAILLTLFAAVAAQAGIFSDCAGCVLAGVPGLKCAYNGPIPGCGPGCNTTDSACTGDDSLGDCNYRSTCDCWYFYQVYLIRHQPTERYDSHQWRLVSTRVRTPAATIARKGV